mgnify:CR=1 FL=1
MSKYLIRSQAPCRISFSGGGTDLEPFRRLYGGCVISATIDRFAYTSIIPREDKEINIYSLDQDLTLKFRIDDNILLEGELKLVKAVLKHFNGLIKTGLDIYIHADAPQGSGAGGSSAMVVSVIGAFNKLLGDELDNYEIAELACKIERIDCGITGGYQDQYSSVFGGCNFIEFLEGDPLSVIVNPLRLAPSTWHELNYNLILCYTGRIWEGESVIAEQAITAESKKHFYDELKWLTLAMKADLLKGDFTDFAQELLIEWENKKKLSQHITTPNVEELCKTALDNGAKGLKLMGAGGGGFILIYTDFTKRKQTIKALEEAGGQITNFRFTENGLSVWRVKMNGSEVK